MSETYLQMVRRLKKDPLLILEELTPFKVDLNHLTVGISGEGAELLELFCTDDEAVDEENIIEELGDFNFYLTGLADLLSDYNFVRPLGLNLPSRKADSQAILRSLIKLNVYAGRVLDLNKKVYAYNKPYEEIKDRMNLAALELMEEFDVFRGLCGYTMQEIKDHNQKKLSTGERARYKDGYSDRAADAREDKQDEE